MGFGDWWNQNMGGANSLGARWRRGWGMVDQATGMNIKPQTQDVTAPTYNAAAFQGWQAPNVGPAAQGAGQVRQAQAPTWDNSQTQGRGYQTDLIGQLQRQAMGQGPSVVQQQLNQATDRNVAQQMAMASANRGQIGAGYQALQAGTQAQQQAIGQAAEARAQEQLNAQGLLGQVAGQMRGQDQGWAQNQAQLGAQLGMFNAGQYNQQLGQDTNALNARMQLVAQLQAQAAAGSAEARQRLAELMAQGDMWRQAAMLSQLQQQNAFAYGQLANNKQALFGGLQKLTDGIGGAVGGVGQAAGMLAG